MIQDWKGWALTQTGLHFERQVSFEGAIASLAGYSVRPIEIRDAYGVYFDGKKVAETYKKHALYRWILEPKGVSHKTILSKKLLPDNAIYVLANNTLFVVEIKFQKVAGSVDEKLQTCDFKNKQYQRLFAPLGITVKYCYILSEWFLKPEYKDVLNYIQAVDCHYFFWELPLEFLGLPNPK